MGRIIIFTGKGGVGKTTVAAAHARKAALEGSKTMLISTDMAHNLGDLFNISLGREPVKVCDNLYALEVDPDYEMEKHYKSIMDAIRNMLPSDGKNRLADEIIMFPGIEELFSLLKIQELYETGGYDLIIVDCAPTGETLSLLKFPELLSWYMEKLFPIGKAAMKVMRPVSRQVFKIELPDKKAMNDIERLYVKLIRLQELTKDRKISSIRLVTIPEKMVVEETKRNYMYLSLYNFNVDGIYINRILPVTIDNPFFTQWLEIQKKYLDELRNVFAGIPAYEIRWYDTDLNGMEALGRLAEDTLADTELFCVRRTVFNEVYEKTGRGYNLKVYLPGARREDIILHISGTDLIIRMGNRKRSIPVPNSLRNMDVVLAAMEEETLTIHFEGESKDGE